MDATAEWDAYATWGHAPVGEAQLASRWKLGSGGAAERSWSWQQAKGKGKADADAASVGIVKSREKGEGVGCWDLRAGDQGMQHVLMPKGQLRMSFDGCLWVLLRVRSGRARQVGKTGGDETGVRKATGL